VGARGGLFRSEDIFNGYQDDFFLFQPRIAIEHRPISTLSVLLSAERIEQALHQLTNSEVGFPNDLWVPASERVQPQSGNQYNLTIDFKPTELLSLKASAYHKSIANILQYREGSSLPTLTSTASFAWQEDVISGTGNSRGIELEAEMESKNYRMDVAYAFTNSTRKFNDLNDGNRYPFRFDQRHGFAANAYIKITPKIWAYANWQFNSGLPQTLFLDDTGYYDPIAASSIDPVETIGSVNQFMLPDFHRLDVGFLATFKKKKLTHELNLGVQNVYNRRNVWYAVQLSNDLLFEGEDPINEKTGLPLLPVLRYRVEID